MFFGEGEPQNSENKSEDTDSLDERLQHRRDYFLGVLQNLCDSSTENYRYQQVMGDSEIGDPNWIQYRFTVFGTNVEGEETQLEGGQFHTFVNQLINALDSEEHSILWLEQPGVGLVVKVEIDES